MSTSFIIKDSVVDRAESFVPGGITPPAAVKFLLTQLALFWLFY
jgi:hypothetical protein